MSLISVIIPAYKRGYVIERAIRSILGQTHQDFEILVVDDGSKDDQGKRILSIRAIQSQ